MGRMGSCCCSTCCLTEAEMDAFAVGVVISGPISPRTVAFTHDGCCHSASALTIDPPTFRICQKVWGYEYEERAVIQQRLIKSKKYFGGSFTLNTINGCPLGLTPPDISSLEACDDVRECGKTERTIGQRVEVWIAVEGSLKEIKVSVFEARLSCGGETPVCKIVVQVSQRFNLAYGQIGNNGFVRQTVRTNQSPCCEQTPSGAQQGVDEYDYNPSCDLPDLDTFAAFDCNTAEFDWGLNADYWVSRYKIYDTIDDVPTTINFTDADTTDCVFSACQLGEEPCFVSKSTPPSSRTPLKFQKIGFMKNCRFCYDYDFECNDCIGFNSFPVDFYVENLWRYVNRNASHAAFTEDGVQDFYRVLSGISGRADLFMDTCHRYRVVSIQSPGPTEAQIAADTNGCFWWDCVDCVYTGDDPIVFPYQQLVPDVTEYDLTESYDDLGAVNSELCVPFQATTVTFNGPATEEPA